MKLFRKREGFVGFFGKKANFFGANSSPAEEKVL